MNFSMLLAIASALIMGLVAAAALAAIFGAITEGLPL